jgi:hypothetical protein
MKKAFVMVLVFAAITALSGVTGWAAEPSNDSRWTSDPPSGEAVLADALIGRPAGVGVCALGIAGAIVAFPFAVISGDTKDLWKALVVDPAAYTFRRPMGQLYDTPR